MMLIESYGSKSGRIFINMKKTLVLVIAIFIVLILVIFLWPVKTNWTEEELQRLGISPCDANNRCADDYDCIALPIKGVYASIGQYVEAGSLRCVPKTLNLCSTFCNRFRGCSLAESLPPILFCDVL